MLVVGAVVDRIRNVVTSSRKLFYIYVGTHIIYKYRYPLLTYLYYQGR